MKKIILLSILPLCLASCSPKQEQKQEEEKSVAKLEYDKSNFASGKDPICQMSIQEHMTDTAKYNGKIYGFCGQACKEEFLKEPAKYTK